MGSGTFKLVMGQVETCQGVSKLNRLWIEGEDRAVGLEAAKNSSGVIPESAQREALQALTDLREKARSKAKELGISSFEMTIVATHAVRTASNQKEILKFWRDAGFDIHPISQNEEALAGYATAHSKAPTSCNGNTLVWDVGGGSTQFVRTSPTGPQVTRYEIGAENFRKTLISDLRFKAKPARGCKKLDNSPNPIGKDQIALGREIAQKLIPKSNEPAPQCTIGIGGVHSKAVLAQLKKNWPAVKACACPNETICDEPDKTYSKKQLTCLAENFATKTDCSPEIKGPYSPTAVSNLLLVLGVMESLDVDQVTAVSVNMGHHFLTSKDVSFTKLQP